MIFNTKELDRALISNDAIHSDVDRGRFLLMRLCHVLDRLGIEGRKEVNILRLNYEYYVKKHCLRDRGV